MFIPPLNMGQFQPSPATMSQWIYQIWQFLQENPIATETEIREFIQSELTQSETLGNAIEDYLTENPPQAPVQSVQGKTGAVQLAYNEIVPASNAVPVYKASSTPATNTLVGQYNLGYRLFVNTVTQEIFTISPAGALSLVGRGKFDGTTVDLNTAQGDTTISEAVTAIETSISGILADVQGLKNLDNWTTESNYCILPNGFKFCWGTTKVTANVQRPAGSNAAYAWYGGTTIAFPIRFDRTPFGLATVQDWASHWTGSIMSVTTTGAQLRVGGDDSDSKDITWLVFGF